MITYKSKPDSFTAEETVIASDALHKMVLDEAYVTEPTFSADVAKYADNLMPFIDKHLAYLRKHPSVDPKQYISNLKLMTKVRR